MTMRYYSELIGKFFDTEEACIAAEAAKKAKKEVEKVRLEEVQKIEKEYHEKLSAFLTDYGYYKSEIVTDGIDITDMFSKLF